VLGNKKKRDLEMTLEMEERRTYRRRDDEHDTIHRIKIYPPIFDGILNPKIFSDWMVDLKYYFDWYMFIKKI